MEQWKELHEAGIAGRYLISDHGRLRNAETKREVKAFEVGSGYLSFNLTSRHIHLYAHRLVLKYFGSGFTARRVQVNHKDGNKRNNHISNLEAVTASANLKHRYRVLRQRVHNQKGTLATSRAVRKLYERGNTSQKRLGRQFGLSTMTINRIINNKVAYAKI